MENTVSIIIPVYNVEKYLNRCIESIVRQTYKNLQIILIDDGSSDNSAKICDEWQKKDSRITVLHKINAGLGEARNSGLELANGDYICFVDGDDYIDNNLIFDCLRFAIDYDLDIVCFGFIMDRLNGDRQEKIPITRQNVFFEDEIQSKLVPRLLAPSMDGYCNNLQMSLCASFIRRKLIIDFKWKCQSERVLISEDVYSLLVLYAYTKRAGIISGSYYHYCENNDSLSHVYRSDRFERNKFWYNECKKMCNELFGDGTEVYLTDQFISNTIATMKMIISNTENVCMQLKDISNILCDPIMSEVIEKKSRYGDTKKRKILLYFMKIKASAVCLALLKIKQ